MPYELHFKRYQYNTGLSDNGHYNTKLRYDDIEQAKTDAAKIAAYVNDRLTDEEKDDVSIYLLPSPGYPTSLPTLFKVTLKQIDIGGAA